MVDAGGTTTLKVIRTVGEYTLYKINNTSVDTTETIPLDGPANSPIAAEDKVMVIGMLNETTEASGAGAALSCEYDETEMHFTITESGAASDSISIFFYILKN